jgi:hypothetical protein
MLLRVGVVMMTFALAFAAVVTFVALHDEPMERAVAAKKPEAEPEREVLPVAEADWPAPTEEEIDNVSEPRHYDLPPGAIMGLTIRAIGVHNAPDFNSDAQWALDNGVSHMPETSLPWSSTPQRNRLRRAD